MNPFYTQTGVYLPLAAKLPAIQPQQIICARFSKLGDDGGTAGQRDATFKTFEDDPDVALLRQIPEEAWDPKEPTVGQLHGVTWIHLSDLHDSLDKQTPVAAVAVRGATVFVSLTLSATQSHIQRDDGSRENGATWLYVSLLNHYLQARAIRWAEDLNRASRTSVGWALVMETCHRRLTRMGFGGRTFDLSEAGDRVQLGILTSLSAEDDMGRRIHLTGKRIAKIDAGGAGVPPEGMPRGWTHAEDEYGRRVKDNGMGFVPVAELSMAPLFQELYPRHADGATFQDLAPLLSEFELRGNLVRRDPKNPGNNYAGLDDAPAGRKNDAIQPFFYIKKSRPKTPPSDAAIDAYLAGAEPADVFDIETRVFIARLELLRTGIYVRRLRNDIKGIGEKGVDGYIPTKDGEDDEYGAFYVESERWPWPVDENGYELERFGIADEVLRKCAARLLRGLSKTPTAKGGRRRNDGWRRLLQNIPSWATPACDPVSRYEDCATSWGVRSRTQKSGKNTLSIMHRPEHVTGEWKYLPGAESASLAEVLSSLASQLDRSARELLNPDEVATVRLADPGPDPAKRLIRLIDELDAEVAQLAEDSRGLRTLAARAMDADDEARVRMYEDDIASKDQLIEAKTAEADRLRRQIVELAAQPEHEEAHGDLSVWAYLIVVLERAASQHGVGLDQDGKLCDRTFTDWRFTPGREFIGWSCHARLPLNDGTTAVIPLHGRVRNISTPKQNQRAQVVHDIFANGRSVDDVASSLGCSRKAAYNRYVMPWLRENGVTAVGAKCSLVDHPLSLVRQIVWAAAVNQDTSRIPATRAYIDHITKLYFDPDTAWGQTAVPDDTTRTQRAIDLLVAAHGVAPEAGLAVADLAEILECTVAKVRDLARPRSRKNGFIRPRFLEYTSHTKDRVRLLTCPHDGQPVTHVALFLEVAASGYGVLCRKCRRAPNPSDEWARRVFPEWYVTTSWTHADGRGSIMESQRTVPSLDGCEGLGKA